MRLLLASGVILGLIISGCSPQPWFTKGETQMQLMLKHVRVIPGEHCESSAINNALHYLGYPANEALIVGGGGAPSFMLEKSEFPFLGGRNLTMRENFFTAAGIKWHLVQPVIAAQSWEGVKEILKQGLPVILRVDMRFLPYLYGGKYGEPYMSFGWHLVTLFGMDLERGFAYVTDTALSGLQQIKLSDLEKARSSNTRVYPPGREYYWIEEPPADFQLDWQKLTIASLHAVIDNMEQPVPHDTPHLFGLTGLETFSRELARLDTLIKNDYLLAPVLDFWYGCIETNGTGGAAFRILYREFIRQAAEQSSTASLRQLLPYLDTAINAWHKLAAAFKELSVQVKKVKDKTARRLLYGTAARAAEAVYQAEKDFYLALKSITL